MDAKLIAQTFNELSHHIECSESGLCSVPRDVLQRARALLYYVPSDATQAPMSDSLRALIRDAARSVSEHADGIKAGCACGEDWPDAEDKAYYDAQVSILERLRDVYAADPVAPAAAAPSIAASIHYPDCWDTAAYPTLESALSEVYAAFKCSECGVEWRPATIEVQPDERTAPFANCAFRHCDLPGQCKAEGACHHPARATESQATQGDETPVEVWHGDRKVSIYSDTVLRVWGANIESEMSEAPRTLQSVGDAIDWLYETIPRTPIYQIGAPGIAGHQVVWWDVSQEEYERQKAAGFMRTGIVYREAT